MSKQNIAAVIIFISTLIVSFFSFMVSAADNKQVDIVINQVKDNFWVLHGGDGLGANVGVSVGDDGIILIDAMNQGIGTQLIKTIRKISNKPIKYVINTHHHGDHNGGNPELVAAGATVIYPNYLKYTPYQGVNRDIQFKGNMTFKANNEVFTLYHVKSHTWNDVIVHLANDNVIFTGDNHATNWGPNVGVLGYLGHRKIMDLIISLSDDKTLIVPGHKELADLTQLKQYDNKTKQWFEQILSLHQQGLSPEEIAKNDKVSALFRWFHQGVFPKWLSQQGYIDRILATTMMDMSSNILLSARQQNKYLGKYQLLDGSIIEITAENNSLFAYKKDDFMVNLLPKSKSVLAFNGWTAQEQFRFEFNQTGQVTSLSFQVNGKVQFTAQPM